MPQCLFPRSTRVVTQYFIISLANIFDQNYIEAYWQYPFDIVVLKAYAICLTFKQHPLGCVLGD